MFDNISYPSWENKINKKLWTLDKTRLGSSSKSSSRFGFEAGSRAGSLINFQRFRTKQFEYLRTGIKTISSHPPKGKSIQHWHITTSVVQVLEMAPCNTPASFQGGYCTTFSGLAKIILYLKIIEKLKKKLRSLPTEFFLKLLFIDAEISYDSRSC